MDSQKTTNQQVNERLFEKKLTNTIENPEEVFQANDIHNDQQDCKVYITTEINDGKWTSHMQETGELNLNDLNRDPQTRSRNVKSVNEANILSRAQEQG